MGTGTSSKASITHIRLGSSCGAGAGGPCTIKTLYALKACYGNEAYASPTLNMFLFWWHITSNEHNSKVEWADATLFNIYYL